MTDLVSPRLGRLIAGFVLAVALSLAATVHASTACMQADSGADRRTPQGGIGGTGEQARSGIGGTGDKLGSGIGGTGAVAGGIGGNG